MRMVRDSLSFADLITCRAQGAAGVAAPFCASTGEAKAAVASSSVRNAFMGVSMRIVGVANGTTLHGSTKEAVVALTAAALPGMTMKPAHPSAITPRPLRPHTIEHNVEIVVPEPIAGVAHPNHSRVVVRRGGLL